MTGREQWLAAAVQGMRAGGIEAVRVETLARALGVTKGSFYWHFRDRADLLEAVLSAWEAEAQSLIAEAERGSLPRERVLRYFRLVSAARAYPPDVEVLAWARRDAVVAIRVELTESARLGFLSRQLELAGVSAELAARGAELLYLATQGWLERARRSAPEEPLESFVRRVLDALLQAPVLAEAVV